MYRCASATPAFHRVRIPAGLHMPMIALGLSLKILKVITALHDGVTRRKATMAKPNALINAPYTKPRQMWRPLTAQAW